MKTLFSLLVAQVEEMPQLPSLVDPELPAELDAITLKALTKDAGHGDSSAKECLTVLELITRPAAGSDFRSQARNSPEAPVTSDVIAAAILVSCALGRRRRYRVEPVQPAASSSAGSSHSPKGSGKPLGDTGRAAHLRQIFRSAACPGEECQCDTGCGGRK